jgi:DNA-binding response OmpR family regulator
MSELGYGTPVPLTSRVFNTLLYMVEHHDAVLGKERIMEAVWPETDAMVGSPAGRSVFRRNRRLSRAEGGLATRSILRRCVAAGSGKEVSTTT